jgi:hypothetical protein
LRQCISVCPETLRKTCPYWGIPLGAVVFAM